MKNWECHKLGDCFRLKSGKNLTHKQMIENGEYPVFGGNGIMGYHNEYNLSGKNVIVGRVGAQCGNVREVDENVWLTDNAFNLVEFKYDFDYSFLTYLLNYKNLRSFAKEAAQPVISNDSLKDIKLEFPKEKTEQRRIVSKLDALFAEIDAAIALIDDNIERAEALKLSVLDEEFSMENEKWKIEDLVNNTKNLNPKDLYKDGKFTYIDITAVNKELNIIDGAKSIKGFDAPSRAKKEIELGDVLFATTRPNLKNVAIVKEDYQNPIASTGFCVLRTKREKLLNRFLFYFLISNIVKDLIQPFIRGAQYPAISDSDLKGLKMPLPSIDMQQKVVQKLDVLFAETDALIVDYTQKRETLEALKSSLLDQAFKGKL